MTREADPYAAAARALGGDIRLITGISINDIKAMGGLIYGQNELLSEIAVLAEQQCVASASGQQVARAILATMVRHGFFDPQIYRQLSEVTPHDQD
ncbi:hypothetical protein [Taklimakanibacter albus]|uniref:Uncharacterized protein n=1 Tax=Taklimakanibacter albus TaxID=2800327 RepID=A0ACC5R7E2_9HYPH|nr:hypothetical protein [Aestuariivirga sp. YIM B02566]MBK1868283.1 hypothetical protein [Aestuariivirga sp. YIM B02566]